MIANGPTRMVLLHTGKYDLAEVELDRAVHLVAPNNVGKTTLIAALQFLYVDRATHMDFSYDLPATKRYYFPDPYAYILFECLTPTGYQVLGVHGQGPAKSFDYERFHYTGPLDLSDYLDEDERPRPWSEIRARLVDRAFNRVEPRDLPTLLTGLGATRKTAAQAGAKSSAPRNPLRIVPVRQRNGYDRFRRLFTHLLKLGRLRQEDLKRVLIETWEPDLHQREVNLDDDFRTSFQQVRRQREDVEALETLVPTIDRALEAAEARDEQREVLPGLWATLQARAQHEFNALTQREADATRRTTREHELAQRAREEAQTHREAELHHASRVAVIEDKLRELDARARDFHDYIPALEDAALQRLDDEIGALEQRLRNARQEDPSRVARDLAAARRRSASVQQRLDNLAHLVVTAARQHLDDTTLARAFAILNPALLGETVSPPGPPLAGLHVHDLPAALEVLRRAAQRTPDGAATFPGQDPALTLPASALHDADVAQYGDADALRGQLRDLQRAIQRLEELEATLRREKPLRDELAAKRTERDRSLARRNDYDAYQRALAGRPDLEAQRDGHAHATQEAQEAREDAERRSGAHDEQAREANEEAEELKGRRDRLRDDLASLAPPRWPHEPPREAPGAPQDGPPLDALFRVYRARTQAEADADTSVRAALAEIERVSYDRHSGDDEAQTLHNLREARDALPERRRSLEEMWGSLVVGLTSAFKRLGDDLETLTSRVDALNRALGRTPVSNLARLTLRLEPNRELGKYVRDVQTNETMPLFGSPRDAQRALERIGELLRERPRVRLEDMFDLHFEVETSDGVRRKYPHLDRIESNGTTVTIKVLVSLHLLRALLGASGRPKKDAEHRVRIPFFLDEVASLDRRNMHGIVQAAEALGFSPILASPEASDAAAVVYYLREGPNGRLVLRPDSPARVEIRRRAPVSGEPGA